MKQAFDDMVQRRMDNTGETQQQAIDHIVVLLTERLANIETTE